MDDLRWPVYYLPPGMPRPDHVVHLGGSNLRADIGPADATPHERGGTLWGGAWDPRLGTLLKKTAAGWWVALGSAQPHHLARLEPVDGLDIDGVNGHRWMVPTLLKARESFGWVSALPREFRDYQWRDPERFLGIQDRLRHLITWEARGQVPDVPDAETTQMAADILAVNYHISLHELSLGGWLDEALVIRILMAACALGDDDG